MLAIAWASLESQHRYCAQPRVYTDTLGRDVLRELYPLADYVVCLDGFFDQYSTELFALAKIQTYSDQTLSYCHVDLDWIWHQPPQPSWSNLDLVVHGWEALDTAKYEQGQRRYYNLEARRPYLKLPSLLHHPDPRSIPAPNMGCVYMQNMTLNRQYCDLVSQVMALNPQEFAPGRPPHSLNICTLEQHFLGFVIDADPDLRCDVVFPRVPGRPRVPVNEQATHFVGEMKGNRYPGPQYYRDELVRPYLTSGVVQRLAQDLETEKQALATRC